VKKFNKLYEDMTSTGQDRHSSGITSQARDTQLVNINDILSGMNQDKQYPNNVVKNTKGPYELDNIDLDLGGLFLSIENLLIKYKSALNSTVLNKNEKEEVKKVVRTLKIMMAESKYIVEKTKRILD